MKKVIVLLAALFLPLAALPAFAAQLRVFVSEMNAIGVPNKDEMKTTLQALLAARLNSDRIMAVGSAAEADAVVSGTYVVLGKVFSMDALARTSGGKTLTRAYIQGDSSEELIPAVGKLAEKLAAELDKIHPGQPAAGAPVAAVPVVAAAAPLAAPKSDIIKNEQVRVAPAGDFIKPKETEQGNTGGWLSKRLTGAANLVALGATLPDGSREVFLAEERRLSYYRQAGEMKLVADTEFRSSEKILSLDTIDGSKGLEIYVTIIRGDELASQVWQVQGDKLVKLAGDLPWFFRAFSLAGGPKKLYVQAMGRDADYFGDVFEATRSGNEIALKNPVKMPRFGTIYTFNQLRDQDGKTLTAVINPDGYLVVYDQEQKEFWRSNDKFGGSELYFQKEDTGVNARVSGEKYRWVFMNMRIQATAGGAILVGKNDGFWVLGNARSYKKGTVYCFSWNGSSLDEKWRTRDTQNYMPDYYFDEAKNELFILQTVQRSGITTRGASSLAIKKVE
ncbi:VCBS repeat-containing protein [Geobacter sp. FeAm09]|uniref:VCBS repeat-containing protein n=1 Tax=Geobacter sp. FeAm09 TaxID=2597769 RepID=UPI0011F02B94|nr:VCBS repeat-containing protein [Geobacter sp. FeAm09]QEM69595.1 VCBS repeat-containing protein [Geobacter sp. FeAm09]